MRLGIDGNNVAHGYLRSPAGKITKFDVPGEGPQGLGCLADCSMGLNDLGGDQILLGREQRVSRLLFASPTGSSQLSMHRAQI